MITKTTVERYVYRNTRSHSGKGERVTINVADIQHVRVWVNSYGNPSYTYAMANGDVLYLVDAYDGMNDLSHRVDVVSRKKDLFPSWL